MMSRLKWGKKETLANLTRPGLDGEHLRICEDGTQAACHTSSKESLQYLDSI